jgi:hypothetical protein
MLLPLLLSTSGQVFANPDACWRYRSELALHYAQRAAEAIDRRQDQRLEQLSGYYRLIGCEQVFLPLGRPALCGPIAHQIRLLEALRRQPSERFVAMAVTEARRQELLAGIDQTCEADQPTAIAETSRETSTRGGKLVCVRACDGYFFPLQNRPAGDASADDMCRALCPNAEMRVFRLLKGGGIERAASVSGAPYMQLPNALRYRTRYDADCSCRAAGESWAEALQKAERMLPGRPTDTLVTEAIADELFRAKLPAPAVVRKPPDTQEAGASRSRTAFRDPASTGSVSRSRFAPRDIPVPRVDETSAPPSGSPAPRIGGGDRGKSDGCSKVEWTTHQSRQPKPSRVIVAQNPNIDPTAGKSGNFSPWRNRRRAIVIS